MSNALLSKAWKLSVEPMAKLLLTRLADAANDAAECWPSIQTLADETCLGKSTVCLWLRRLEERGYISRSPGRTTTTYVLHLDSPSSSPPCPPDGQQVSTTCTSPPHGHVHHVDTTCPPHGQDDVHHVDNPCPPRGHKPKENPNKNPKGTQTDGAGELQLGELLPFASAEFAAAWSDWEKHRREKRQRLTPSTKARQLKMLQGLGEARAIAAIHQSISNGWTGLFEPRSAVGGGKSPTAHVAEKPPGNGWGSGTEAPWVGTTSEQQT